MSKITTEAAAPALEPGAASSNLAVLLLIDGGRRRDRR